MSSETDRTGRHEHDDGLCISPGCRNVPVSNYCPICLTCARSIWAGTVCAVHAEAEARRLAERAETRRRGAVRHA